MEQRGEMFDYILLETTGLADPGNIAPMFWLDDGLGSSIFLDGIVTLVDAKNVLKSLDEGYGIETNEDGHAHDGPLLTTAHLQISHADVIVINKTDLVSAEELKNVIERIQSINGLARIETTTKSQVPHLEGLVLDLHAYDEVTDADLKFASKGHSHLDSVRLHAFSVLEMHLAYTNRPSQPPQSRSQLSPHPKCPSSTFSFVPSSGKKSSHETSCRTVHSRFTASKLVSLLRAAECCSYKAYATYMTRMRRMHRALLEMKKRNWC
jgi:G3E family GTPase